MTMKIHFTSSNSKEALSLKSKYCELYNQANIREADVIVAIGGDGEMLKALRLAIKNNSSVFGLNKGHIGFLMNKINKTNLIKRINKASQLTVHPLEMECFDHKGKKQKFLGRLPPKRNDWRAPGAPTSGKKPSKKQKDSK